MKPLDPRERYHQFSCLPWRISEDGLSVTFNYQFDDGELAFEETITWPTSVSEIPEPERSAALKFVSLILGTSYYKCFPTQKIEVPGSLLDEEEAQFFTALYKHGLGEFCYVNDLTLADIGSFQPSEITRTNIPVWQASHDRALVMQSGGKDSLTAAWIMNQAQHLFDSWYVSSTGHHPKLIDKSGGWQVSVVQRRLDVTGLSKVKALGGLNGHVPFSAILAALAVVSALSGGYATILTANEASANEPTGQLADGMWINHQYAKTLAAEVALQDYIQKYINPQLRYGSLLRPFTEVAIVKLFVQSGMWANYHDSFSSCNTNNYRQGHPNSDLTWCGKCAKCANNWILFSSQVSERELLGLFGSNLYQDRSLQPLFEELLGLTVHKPFECVGEIDELRWAYFEGLRRSVGLKGLDIDVPQPTRDPLELYKAQGWVTELLKRTDVFDLLKA